uniref:Putative resolvase domain containing protein n=1 Tax=viral metagenome TaxID=1070528 RepID=A0A6M3LLG3_9ZZZZ
MKAIIYTRFSPRPDSQDCDSCEKQEERCRAYCERKGYHIGGIQSDPDTSGGHLERPGLKEAIQQLMGIDGDCVLVADASDRLARDMLVSLTIRYQVEKAGGRIEYANGTPVTETPEGRLLSDILAAFASYERDRIRHATSRGMKRRQANGEWFGKPGVGFMRDPENSKKLIECPDEQEAIAAIQTLRNAGCYSSEEIAKRITEGFGKIRGKPWSARTVRKIIAKHKEIRGQCLLL